MHRLLTALLTRLLPLDERDALLGDVAEEYARQRRQGQHARADLWRLRQLLASTAFALTARRRPRSSTTAWQFAADLRYAARGLRRAPGFAVAAILSLATGIGASTAIFSVAYPVLIDPLPFYPEANRIAMVWYSDAGGTRAMQTFGTYRELETRARAFESLAAIKPWLTTVSGGGEPERLDGQRVSASYFRVLGVTPVLGRDFAPDEDRPNGANVVIVSDGLWRRRFGGDRGVIGRQMTIADVPFIVIGVMPSTFENVLAPAAEVWAPLQYDSALPPQGREWGHHLRLVGRTREGVSLPDAERDIDQIARAPVGEFPRQPWASMADGLIVDSLRDDVAGPVRPALFAVIGAVGLLLAIACVNVMHLLLARGSRRRAEFAMRAALGAGRGRLIRQLLAESTLLAFIAGALGLALAEAGARVLIALGPPELPRVHAMGLNGAVFLFAAGLSALVGGIVGLVPALHISRRGSDLAQPQRSRTTAGAGAVARRILVIGEVALAVVLLVGAGLLLRSVRQLFAVEPGFNTDSVLTMQVQVPSVRRLPDADAQHQFFARTIDAVRQVPEVMSAAFTSQLPLSNDQDAYGVHLEAAAGTSAPAGDAFRYAVSPNYFDAMRIPLRRGRLLTEADMTGATTARPVVVNESFARQLFGDRDPIGQRLRFAGPATRAFDVVVGVVGDIRQTSLTAPRTNAIYVAAQQWLWADNPRWLVVRARANPLALLAPVKRAIWSVDANIPISRVSRMADLVERSGGGRRFALVVFQAFGLVALLLAATGIFGVLSGSVTERLREIGVRSALGASHSDIVSMIVRQGLTLAAVGVVIGVTGAMLGSRALTTLLFGVTRFDPLTYVIVISLIAAVAAAACWIPAWRAARVDPVVVLRAE